MDRNVAQDHSVHHMVCPQLAKVFTVLIVSKDVMVTADQNLVTVQPTHDAQGLAVDNYVT
jgi:hypothetical protein